MKLVVQVFLLSVLILAGCKKDSNNHNNNDLENVYASYGEKITSEKALTKEEMATKFGNLSAGDTINVKFATTINEVCKQKGCWMKLDLGNEKESMVRFKDYGFFVPMNADNKEVVVAGKAYVSEISVDQLKHYAKDAGKSDEEIAQITTPEFTYAFEANGVLIKE